MPDIRNILKRQLASLGRRFQFDAVYIAKGSAWLNGRLIFSTILTFGLSVAFANLLSPEEYGQYKFIISAVTLWGALLLAGANTAVASAVARGAQRTFLASIPLQIRWDLAAALCIAGTGVYYISQGNSGVGIPLLASAILYPASAVLNTYSAYFGGIQDFRRQATYESITSAVYFGTIITALFLGANAGLLAILFFAANAVGHSIGFMRAKRMVDRSTGVEPGALDYAKQLSLVSIPGSLMLQLDNILVFHYLGSVELATYTFAMLGPDKLGSVLKFIPLIALPKYAQRNAEDLRDSVPRRSLQFSALGAMLGVAYALAAPIAFKIFFPQYLAAVPYSQVYALSLVAAGAMLSTSSLMAQGRIRRIAVMQFFLPIVQLVVTYLGIRHFGLAGAIGAKLVADFANYAISAGLHQYQRAPNNPA